METTTTTTLPTVVVLRALELDGEGPIAIRGHTGIRHTVVRLTLRAVAQVNHRRALSAVVR